MLKSTTNTCNIALTLFVLFPQFGDSQKLRLVRILRSTVMVRVGGGWVALDEFLVKNDPCRGEFSLHIYINYTFTLFFLLIRCFPWKYYR